VRGRGKRSTVAAAIDTIAGREISELPVVDSHNRPIGLIDITDKADLPCKCPAL
jgi:CBS domain-containing protein